MTTHRAVLQREHGARRRAWQLASLADRHEGDTETLSDQDPEEEAASVESDDRVERDARLTRLVAQKLDAVRERSGVPKQGEDVPVTEQLVWR